MKPMSSFFTDMQKNTGIVFAVTPLQAQHFLTAAVTARGNCCLLPFVFLHLLHAAGCRCLPQKPADI